jgi:hypothetical protein
MARPPPPPPKPLRFISVVGTYHSGTTALWKSIKSNEGIATAKGIDLKAYGMSDASGYPPCEVPVLNDSSVDMDIGMGNSSGIDEPNTHLFAQYGAMWGDWSEEGPYTLDGVLKMAPPHKRDVFYSWWKHTPPQHPVLACFRPDTLYVVVVRHPKVWGASMKRKSFDFKYEPLLRLWRLHRINPRHLPPLEMRFRSLYNAWEYYMKGYLSWESMSIGKNCYAGVDSKINCLGGTNNVPKGHRNILLVRYEDYLTKPKRVLADIFSFASRGLIDTDTNEDNFVINDAQELEVMNEMLTNLKAEQYFSSTGSDWDGATQLTKLCAVLGYSCDESPAMIVESSQY